MTSTAPHDRSTLAGVAWGLALTAAVAVVLAPLAIQAGAVSPFLGFRVFGGALLASLLTLALALVALFVSRRSPAGRRVAIRAVLLSGALVLLLGVLATPASDVPPIHDVTTDPVTGRSVGADISRSGGVERVNGSQPFLADLDIAGMADVTSDTPLYPKGPTGYGVRLLVRAMETWK